MTGGSVAVDLHCHILPGLDEGARDLDDTVAMAEQARADGIEATCATPHIRHDHDVALHELPDRLAELAEALRASGCGTRVLSGGEVAVTTHEELDDSELACVSLGGSRRWILLEPPPGPLDDRLERVGEELHARGFSPLVAHSERHLARIGVSACGGWSTAARSCRSSAPPRASMVTLGSGSRSSTATRG
jgi:protein-tyrosine phosphatase